MGECVKLSAVHELRFGLYRNDPRSYSGPRSGNSPIPASVLWSRPHCILVTSDRELGASAAELGAQVVRVNEFAEFLQAGQAHS